MDKLDILTKTKTFTYLLPCLGLITNRFKNQIVNAFIGDDEYPNLDNHLFVLYEFSGNVEFLDFEEELEEFPIYECTYDPLSKYVMKVFKIPEDSKEDFQHFKKSKYSHLSKILKTKIMAQYLEVLEETKTIFDEAIVAAGLDKYIDIKILANNDLKEIGKASKANDIVKYMNSIDVIIVLNEDIFDQLEEHQRLMKAEEILAGIVFDPETSKLTIKKGDVQTYSGFLRKYGYDTFEVMEESIKTFFNVKNNKGEESSEVKTVDA